jgi:phage terminase large subunit
MPNYKIPYQPRRVFMPFHTRTERWAVAIAHRRCGKTVACINDLIAKALTDGKADGQYAYICPFMSQAKSVAWNYLLRYSATVQTKANNSELWVELVTGARIRLFGADNPEALRGMYLDGIVLDEYADMKSRVWGEIIRPLLADREGWAVFIGTPKGKNAFWDIYNAATRSAIWHTTKLKASETKILPESELADAASMMGEDQYLQEFECSFEAAIVGAFYGKEMRDAEDSGRIGVVPYDRAATVSTAWDLGFSDDTSIVFFQVVRGEIHIIDHFSGSGLAMSDYLAVIASKGYRYGTHWLPHDAKAKTLASGGKSIQEMAQASLGAGSVRIVPGLSLQDGIQALRAVFPRLWMDRVACDTHDLLESLKQYQREWDDDKKRFRDRPRHDWTSHSADAMRYMAIAWREERGADKVVPPKFFHEQTLDELWQTSPQSSRRI